MQFCSGSVPPKLAKEDEHRLEEHTFMVRSLILALLFVAAIIGPVFLAMRSHAAKENDPRTGHS